MRLILLGPPGSGKGTQAQLLCRQSGLVHIGTGDILRDAVRLGTPAGKQAKPYMDQGKYVPDALVNAIVAEKLRQPGRPERFIMDGYPRTEAQAIVMDGILEETGLRLHHVLLLNVPDDEIVRRITGRRVCSQCGQSYHVDNKPPRVAGQCDSCGRPLVQRVDDQDQTVRERLHVFHATMPAVIEHYRRQGLLQEIDGEGSIQSIADGILRQLDQEPG